MQQYILKRALLFIPTIVLVTILVFGLMRLIPGDPAFLILAGGGEGNFTQQELDNLRHKLGTDRHILVQYGDWVWGLLQGDMGTALFYGTTVTSELGPRVPLTIELAIMAAIISFILAVPLGMISALKQDSWFDYAARIFTFTGISIPIFVTGLVVVYLLVRIFGWFPPLGYAQLWEDPLTNLQQLIFPALTLAFFQLNFTARVTRSAMLEVMRDDYIRTARSKGLAEMQVVFLHALKNALLPIVTVSGWALGLLLGGTIIIEKIFVVPGMGALLLQAITARDYILVMGDVLVFALAVMIVNLAVDMIYGWLDPRIRYG
jgi:peptide/nickel transport system permease protein